MKYFEDNIEASCVSMQLKICEIFLVPEIKNIYIYFKNLISEIWKLCLQGMFIKSFVKNQVLKKVVIIHTNNKKK